MKFTVIVPSSFASYSSARPTLPPLFDSQSTGNQPVILSLSEAGNLSCGRRRQIVCGTQTSKVAWSIGCIFYSIYGNSTHPHGSKSIHALVHSFSLSSLYLFARREERAPIIRANREQTPGETLELISRNSKCGVIMSIVMIPQHGISLKSHKA